MDTKKTVKEVAEILNVNVPKVRQYIKANRLKAEKIMQGEHYYYLVAKSDIEIFKQNLDKKKK